MNTSATTPPPADLMALSEKATPGPFSVLNVIDDECLLGFGIDKLDQDAFDQPAPWYSIWLKVNEKDARLMVALVNWFRSQDWTRPSLSAQAVGYTHATGLPIGGVTVEEYKLLLSNGLGDGMKPVFIGTPPQPADGGDRVGADVLEIANDLHWAIVAWRDEMPSAASSRLIERSENLRAALAKFQPAGGENDGR